MDIIAKTRKSHYYNEDRFVVGKNFAMVIDGATSLEKSNLKPTEACWLVNRIKKEIVKENGSIVDRLTNISRRAYEQFKKMTSLQYLPSAGIAWVEFIGDEIIAYTIGDCEIVLKKKNGEIIQLLNRDLVNLDKKALEQMEIESKKRQISFLKTRPFVDNLLIEHRKLINKPNGYKAFTLDSDARFQYTCHRFIRNDFEEVYLFTDGLTLAYDELKIYPNIQEMFSKSLNLNDEIAKIVAKSYADPLCDKYHRFKLLDDITVIKIVFK